MSLKSKEEKNTITVTIVILGGITIVLWLIFSWGTSIMRTHQINNAIEKFRAENERQEGENSKLLEEMLYLESSQYKDKWAKERKNKVNPGENVIVLPTTDEQSIEKQFEGLTERQQKIEILKTQPKREQWWEYFFGDPI